ncbi:MAG: hypothetical protein R3C26_05430 [Calditrichia bacterium]
MQSLNMKDRGVKQAGFWVMVGASMPGAFWLKLDLSRIVTMPKSSKPIPTSRKLPKGSLPGCNSSKQTMKIQFS